MSVMVVLGVTWLVGAFTFGSASLWFQYAFTILNGLQVTRVATGKRKRINKNCFQMKLETFQMKEIERPCLSGFLHLPVPRAAEAGSEEAVVQQYPRLV